MTHPVFTIVQTVSPLEQVTWTFMLSGIHFALSAWQHETRKTKQHGFKVVDQVLAEICDQIGMVDDYAELWR